MDVNRPTFRKGLAATLVAAAVVKVLGGGSTPDVRSKVFVLLDGAFALVRHADFYLALAPVVSGHIYKVQHKDVKGTNMFEIVLPKENLIGRESEHIAPEFMNLQDPPADELENPSKVFRVKLPIPTEITC